MTCTIIATGNSLRGFDFKRVKGYTIGINHAYFYCKTDINCIIDMHLPLFYNAPNVHTIGKQYDRTMNIPDISFKSGVVGDFRSTLLFAINVAVLKGFKTIHILGADGYVDTYRHFFDTEINTKQPTDLGRFTNLLKRIEPQLADYQIYLYGSKIPAFKHLPLTQYVYDRL